MKLSKAVIYLDSANLPSHIEIDGRILDNVSKASGNFIARELVVLDVSIYCESITTKHGVPTVADDARDAARYRWLRSGNVFRGCEADIRGGSLLDTLCDEGIAND